MPDGRKEPAHREVLDAVVDYLHRLANGEYPEKITESEIPDDLKPIVRMAALLGFQLESRDRHRDQSVRVARREVRRLVREVGALKEEVRRRPDPAELDLPGAVRDRVFAIAKSGADVAVVGESKDKRDRVARMFHRAAGRNAEAFVVVSGVSAGEATDGRLDEVLFGAVGRKERVLTVGAFERAEDGTLFLDEASTVDLGTQARIERFLVERRYLPSGGAEPRSSSARLVLGLSESLSDAVRDGKLRSRLAHLVSENVIVVSAGRGAASAACDEACVLEGLAIVRARAEAKALRDALRLCRGNQAAAARGLGISRESFRRKMRSLERES